MKHRRVHLFCVAVLLAAALSGCGPGNPLGREAVSGKVVVDGQPLPRGLIHFVPRKQQGTTRTGTVITNGEYALPTEKGLPPGEYVVSLLAVERTEILNPNTPPGSESFAREKRQRIPVQYNLKSELVREVTNKGPNVFDFDIKTR